MSRSPRSPEDITSCSLVSSTDRGDEDVFRAASPSADARDEGVSKEGEDMAEEAREEESVAAESPESTDAGCVRDIGVFCPSDAFFESESNPAAMTVMRISSP